MVDFIKARSFANTMLFEPYKGPVTYMSVLSLSLYIPVIDLIQVNSLTNVGTMTATESPICLCEAKMAEINFNFNCISCLNSRKSLALDCQFVFNDGGQIIVPV